MGRNSLYLVKWKFLKSLNEEEEEFIGYLSENENDGSYYIDKDSLVEAKADFKADEKDLSKLQDLFSLIEKLLSEEDADSGISVAIDK